MARARTQNSKGERSHAWLVVLSGGLVGTRHTIALGRTDIGRSPGVAVSLDDDEVSRHHAYLLNSPAGVCILHDSDSRNGTLVNGKRAERAILSSGDRIQLGGHVLLFSRRSDAQEEVLQRQRLEAVGRMAAGVVHDFNNMLGVILANADFLKGGLDLDGPSPAESRECLEDILDSVERAQGLTRRLLDLSRSRGGAYREVDLSELCHETSRLLRSVIPRPIDLQCEIASDLRVLGDYADLHHVLVNLMLNARDAMPDGGLLRLCAERRAGDTVAVAVSDSGFGMAEETAARVFEPFFTTKERGTGLGLATARELVMAHGGTIAVDSRQGKGTTFEISLPAWGSKPGQLHISSLPPPPPGGRRADALVLIVDDEPAARSGASRILKRAGYRVLEARDGREGVKRYVESESRPDLVLLDLNMPFLDGWQTMALLRKLDPDVRVVICSGMDEAAQSKALAEGALAAVSKPVGANALLQAVDRALAMDDGDSEDAVTKRHFLPPPR